MSTHTKRHDATHPEAAHGRSILRRAREAAAAGSYTDDDVARIRKRQFDRCYYCGDALDSGGQIDHKQPVSRGGTHDVENLALACGACNGAKHNKTVAEFEAWRRERGMIRKRTSLDLYRDHLEQQITRVFGPDFRMPRRGFSATEDLKLGEPES